jgi:hypothetical protein
MRVTLQSGEVREASQGHFRGGREEPISAAALEAKFIANCRYGGWDADRARSALAVLRGLHAAPRVDLAELRDHGHDTRGPRPRVIGSRDVSVPDQ